MIDRSRGVAVIIAAYNCSRTIGRAVSSALSQPEVEEVVVVDDASTDATVSAAMVDDGSDRLTILRQDSNRGPAAARNRAIQASRSNYIAILDSDDYFLPNRFASLSETVDWDMVADNVAFVQEGTEFPAAAVARFEDDPRPITLTEFVEGNISRHGRPRAELGFIKPVMRRSFLATAGLLYDETLRLGEDYALYTSMLAHGARFARRKSCGYVATERVGSLSGQHRTQDLEALLAFDEKLVAHPNLTSLERIAVTRHRDHLLSKVHHRRILDKRKEGLIGAVVAALAKPRLLPRLVMSVARDKFGGRASTGIEGVRYLFN